MNLVCAAVNIGTSYLAAKITGQEYTWKNALVDGAVGFFSVFGGLAQTFVTIGGIAVNALM